MHVKSMHTDLDIPFSATESPILQHVIHGIKRFHREKDHKPKQPITLSVLKDILAQLKPETTPGHKVVYAACCVAFTGLLQCGEFTAKSVDKKFSLTFQLLQASVQFLPSFEATEQVILFLSASKTDPFHKGISICLTTAPRKLTCPVAALKSLFTESDGTAHNSAWPLFPSPDDPTKPITWSFFISTICKALSAAGYNPSLFAGHSFRCGGASTAAAAGCSDVSHQLYKLDQTRIATHTSVDQYTRRSKDVWNEQEQT
ncbi:uncharacterized protein EV420DRAFT_1651349 [Desarmillaria tabescens]|uniref:Tyr recombinase domain-containing protein n=1 Tax=Armillaria tabescens TaxID=1929756 RepID=A0AA39J9K4_ARMTA|nr:uncharacterized protein EV420DRAFT_1651349 [Desarmillaria tabescens]KAK0438685.1 hypothetical protein EV420DRAFT_1651349 [Desarmillaria tabescens]